MKMIALHNPSKSDIIEYPIDELELDEKGELIMGGENKPKITGNTQTWTLKAGETLKFPFYVAEYLKKIYDFLEIKGESEVKEEVKGGVGESGEGLCKKCGKEFKSAKGLALHYAHSHPELL